MSFKRDGNDPGLLKNLQHKRVSEILGDFIPDDEALLLSNGRLTCTICPKRPIFDTIQMLSIHRRGKNHLYELSRYLQQKRDAEHRKCKKTRSEFIGTGRLSTGSTSSSPLAFIARSLTQPNKGKWPGARKFVLDTSESCKIKLKNNNPARTGKSANSQVRHYLKSLSRKRSIGKTVEEKRWSYPEWERVKSEKGAESQSGTAGVARSKVDESQLKMLESGWIRDSDGKWVKDPNVEFDSEEEESPE